VPTKEQLEAARKAVEAVDWARVDRTTDREIEAAVDADDILATPAELEAAVANARARKTAAE
jgi:hypothetical protein